MMDTGIGNGLHKILGSSMLLSNKLTASSEYIRLLGMRVVNGKRTRIRFRLIQGGTRMKPAPPKPKNIAEYFPPSMKPRPGQLEALRQIDHAFKEGKRYFVYEGPTGSGKSAVAKSVLNAYETGIITAPLNTLVGQYAADDNSRPCPKFAA